MSLKLIIQLLMAVLTFVFALGTGVYLFVAAILKLAPGQSELVKTIVAVSGTILAAVISLVAGKLLEQRLRIRDEIRSRKIPIYEKHLSSFFKVFFGQQISGRAPSQEELIAAFAEFAQQAIIWGSVDVIRAWVRFRSLDQRATPPQQQLDALEDLFLSIRKDIGSETRRLGKGELFGLFVNDKSPEPER